MFKRPVADNLNFERHDFKTNKTHHSQMLGSYIGGFLSILTVVFFFVYAGILIAQMESGDID